MTETGPASSWVLHCLTPGTASVLPSLTRSLGSLFPVRCHPDRGRLCSLPLLPAPGWGRTALLAPQHLPHQLGPCGGTLPTAVPPSLQLLQVLDASWHALCPAAYLPRSCGLAQWWRSHPFHLWSYLCLLGGAEQPQGSVPTFPSTVLGDCIFGIELELYLHSQEMCSLILAQLRPC